MSDMYNFSDLPKRRKTAFLFHSIFTGLLVVLGTYSVGLFGVKSDLGVFVLLGLFVLGLCQLINAVYNSLQGSRMQLLYFIASLFFLGIYIFSLFFGRPSTSLGGAGEYLLLLSPLFMATVYCFILYIDHPMQYKDQQSDEASNTLDSGIRWEK